MSSAAAVTLSEFFSRINISGLPDGVLKKCAQEAISPSDFEHLSNEDMKSLGLRMGDIAKIKAASKEVPVSAAAVGIAAVPPKDAMLLVKNAGANYVNGFYKNRGFAEYTTDGGLNGEVTAQFEKINQDGSVFKHEGNAIGMEDAGDGIWFIGIRDGDSWHHDWLYHTYELYSAPAKPKSKSEALAAKSIPLNGWALTRCDKVHACNGETHSLDACAGKICVKDSPIPDLQLL